MSENNITPNIHTDAYWLLIDKLYAAAEEKNLKTAIKRTDTEKFYAFMSMLRVANTLNKIRVLEKK